MNIKLIELALAEFSANKTFQIMAKHNEFDADYSPKTIQCFLDILDNDDNEFDEETNQYNYEKQSEKDYAFFEGQTVQYGDYSCYLKCCGDTIEKALKEALEHAKKNKLYKEFFNLVNEKKYLSYLIRKSFSQVQKAEWRKQKEKATKRINEIIAEIKG